MMCYKDRSWCSHSDLCKNEECDRKFKASDRTDAIKWWGSDQFPLMVADLKTEDCGAIL